MLITLLLRKYAYLWLFQMQSHGYIIWRPGSVGSISKLIKPTDSNTFALNQYCFVACIQCLVSCFCEGKFTNNCLYYRLDLWEDHIITKVSRHISTCSSAPVSNVCLVSVDCYIAVTMGRVHPSFCDVQHIVINHSRWDARVKHLV